MTVQNPFNYSYRCLQLPQPVQLRFQDPPGAVAGALRGHLWGLLGWTRARAQTRGTQEGGTDPPGARLCSWTALITRLGCDLSGAAWPCASSASGTPSNCGFRALLPSSLSSPAALLPTGGL